MDTTFLYLILFVGVFAAVFAVLIKKGWIFKGFVNKKGPLDRRMIWQKWQEAENLAKQKQPSAYKAAIVEADKLVDYVLKSKIGVNGTMADRLKKSRSCFVNYSDYDNLWKAHKVRNRIAHEAGYELLYPEVKRAMEYYEKALKELRAI